MQAEALSDEEPVDEAKAIIQRYQACLAGEPVIYALDTNPIAPLAVAPVSDFRYDVISCGATPTYLYWCTMSVSG